MKKKSLLLIMAAVVLTAAIIAGAMACTTVPDGEYVIVAPDGAPALAIAGLAEEAFTYSDTVSVGAQVVNSGEISKRAATADMAIVPANVAANLYNKGTDIKVIATVTHGNLYMVGLADTPEVTDLTQLEGQIVASIGQNSVPDSLFKAMLTKAGVEYVVAGDTASVTAAEGKVTLVYGADGSAVIPLVVTGKAAYGIIGEPAVSTGAKNKGLTEKASLQELWNEANNTTGGYSQAVLIMKSSLAEDTAFVNALLERLAADVEEMTSGDEGAAAAAAAIKGVYEATSLPASITADIIKRSSVNIVSAATESGLDEIYSMLTTVAGVNANSIGGSVPAKGSSFYFAQ